LLLPSLAVAGLLIGYLTPGGVRALQLAIPGLLVIPVLTLAPALADSYLPLARPAARGDQAYHNIGLMFVSMIAMTIVLGITYIAWKLEVLWYMVAIEFLVVIGVYYLMNRAIRR